MLWRQIDWKANLKNGVKVLFIGISTILMKNNLFFGYMFYSTTAPIQSSYATFTVNLSSAPLRLSSRTTYVKAYGVGVRQQLFGRHRVSSIQRRGNALLYLSFEPSAKISHHASIKSINHPSINERHKTFRRLHHVARNILNTSIHEKHKHRRVNINHSITQSLSHPSTVNLRVRACCWHLFPSVSHPIRKLQSY